MRKAFWPLVAAALILAVAIHWWPPREIAVSIVPGWHATILSPWFVTDLVASAGLLLVALVILVTQLSEWKRSER